MLRVNVWFSFQSWYFFLIIIILNTVDAYATLAMCVYLSEWTFFILSFLSIGTFRVLDRAKQYRSETQLMFLKMPYGISFCCCCCFSCGLLYTEPHHILHINIQTCILLVSNLPKTPFGLLTELLYVRCEYKFGALFVINTCNNKDTIISRSGNKRYYLEFWPRIPLHSHIYSKRQLCPQKHTQICQPFEWLHERERKWKQNWKNIDGCIVSIEFLVVFFEIKMTMEMIKKFWLLNCEQFKLVIEIKPIFSLLTFISREIIVSFFVGIFFILFHFSWSIKQSKLDGREYSWNRLHRIVNVQKNDDKITHSITRTLTMCTINKSYNLLFNECFVKMSLCYVELNWNVSAFWLFCML